MSSIYSDTTVIIPTLNEAKNIGRLLDIILELYPKISVVVADDGSSDDTEKIVNRYQSSNQRIKFLNRSQENIHGLTISVIDGVRTTNTKYVVVIDGDLQHPPEKIGEIIKSLREKDCLVVGVREKVIAEWLFYRRIMSKAAMLFGKMILFIRGKPRCKDILSGFFGIQKEKIIKIVNEKIDKFEPEGYKILFDLLKNLPKNEKVEEIPYSFGNRYYGRSKISKRHIWIYFKSLFK